MQVVEHVGSTLITEIAGKSGYGGAAGIHLLVEGGPVLEVFPTGHRSMMIGWPTIGITAVSRPRIKQRFVGAVVTTAHGSIEGDILAGFHAEKRLVGLGFQIPIFREQGEILAPSAGGRVGKQPHRDGREVVEKILGHIKRTGRRDEIALPEVDRLAGGCGIGQQRIHAKHRRIDNRVRLDLRRPARNRIIGGLVWLWETGFLILSANPPGETPRLISCGK